MNMDTTKLIAETLGVSAIAVLTVATLFYAGYKKLCALNKRLEDHEDECRDYRKEMRSELREVSQTVARIEGKLDVQ